MEHRLNVLVVDDSADDRFLLCRALQKTGFAVEVFEADGGSEAIAFLEKTEEYPRPDLILLDLKMYGRSGFDVLNWLEQHPAEPRIRVVVLSGSNLEWDMDAARAYGAADYLVKPATVEQLRSLLGLAAGQKQSELGLRS